VSHHRRSVRRWRAAALTEWVLAFTLLVLPALLAGGAAYAYMIQSWSLGRVAATVGESYTTSGTLSVDDFTAAAARYGVTLTPYVDTLAISITPARAGCGATVAAAGWGTSPVICQGDLVTVRLSKSMGSGSSGGTAPLFTLPSFLNATATWSGVSQRDTVGSATTSSGSTLGGTVTTESGAAVVGATVTLAGNAPATTGVGGVYCMGATGCIPSSLTGTGATQTLKVQAAGYLEAATTILVPVGGSVDQDFTLIAGSQITITLAANPNDGERLSSRTFDTDPAAGANPTWAKTASTFVTAPLSVTHDAAAGTLVIQTGTTASAGVRTLPAAISGGNFKSGASYTASLRVKGDVGAPIALIVGVPGTTDYAATTATGTGAWETISVNWIPTSDRGTGTVEFAVRGNNDSAVNYRLEIDNASLQRTLSSVTGATITTGCAAAGSATCSKSPAGGSDATGLTATESGSGRYVITLRAGDYYFVVRTSDGVTTYSGVYNICTTNAAGCEAVTGPTGGSLSITVN
jgi:hypothetical protein